MITVMLMNIVTIMRAGQEPAIQVVAMVQTVASVETVWHIIVPNQSVALMQIVR